MSPGWDVQVFVLLLEVIVLEIDSNFDNSGGIFRCQRLQLSRLHMLVGRMSPFILMTPRRILLPMFSGEHLGF